MLDPTIVTEWNSFSPLHLGTRYLPPSSTLMD